MWENTEAVCVPQAQKCSMWLLHIRKSVKAEGAA
jgi:hypothetical protein